MPRRGFLTSGHVGLAALAFSLAAAAPAGASTEGPPETATPTASGSIGVRLLDAPAAATDDPRAQLYVVDHLAQGTTINRRIEVSNTTASTAHIALYPSAATIVSGAFLGASGRSENDLSTWTSVSPAAPDVPAGATATATVTVSVPRDAAPGERYAVVWAEARAAARNGVVQVNRVGIRLYVSVGPGGSPAADFTIDAVTAGRSSDGRPSVVAAVHNTGGRALDLNGSLQLLSGPGGLRAGPFPATLGTTLAIGDTKPVTIALDDRLPAGPWDARVVLRSGQVERSARATITFPVNGEAAAVVVTPADPDLTRYLAVAGAAVLLLLGAGGLLVMRSRRRPLVTRTAS